MRVFSRFFRNAAKVKKTRKVNAFLRGRRGQTVPCKGENIGVTPRSLRRLEAAMVVADEKLEQTTQPADNRRSPANRIPQFLGAGTGRFGIDRFARQPRFGGRIRTALDFAAANIRIRRRRA